MWVYEQSTGKLYKDNQYVGVGYSGIDKGLNNPKLENDPEIGPLPAGHWKIGTAFDHPHLGPNVMHLSPEAGTNTFGRSGFFIHGDNSKHNHTGSHGCLVFAPSLRSTIINSGERNLLVVDKHTNIQLTA